MKKTIKMGIAILLAFCTLLSDLRISYAASDSNNEEKITVSDVEEAIGEIEESLEKKGITYTDCLRAVRICLWEIYSQLCRSTLIYQVLSLFLFQAMSPSMVKGLA